MEVASSAPAISPIKRGIESFFSHLPQGNSLPADVWAVRHRAILCRRELLLPRFRLTAGLDEHQGYYFAERLETEEMADLLARRLARSSAA